jgi:sugar phosphate isomerase/epimerase
VPISRRRFLGNASIAAAACGLGVPELMAAPALPRPKRSQVELLGSYWTIAGATDPSGAGREYSLFDFRDRVETMASAGFTGIGLWHSDLDHILETRSLAEMKRILDDNGMRHVELEFLLDWFLDGERRQKSDERRAMLLNAAEMLGARHVKVGDFFGEQAPMDRIIESFAGLCADAANAGTRILFEVMPFAMISNLKDTLTMLGGANADNGGVILDTWHVVKMGESYDDVARFPKRFLLGIELNDGYRQTPDGMTMREETVNHRLLPGDGEFDVPAFIGAVHAAGYDGPWGVEVINAELRTWPLDKLVARAWETTIAQFEE